MLQLSDNPQLIKCVASVINFFMSWTERFSARKAKVDFFVLIHSLFASAQLRAANGRCVLRSDSTNFKEKQLCKVKVFAHNFLRAEPENVVNMNYERL